ncbi:ImuA family protein [Hoeflea sp. TYP-13]|uniref:ImuA family protein n=1 Tax=Hoeflea sp. TYP-13 TaxID=3230023 RepID=UPI0034C5C493
MQGNRQRIEALQGAVARIDRRHASFARHARMRGDSGTAAFGINAIDAVFEDGFPVFALHEVRCSLTRDIGAATGFLAGLIAGCMKQRQGRIVWICDPACRLDGGQLFPAGLSMFGLDPARLVLVRPADLKSALWASDEAAKCADLAGVVFQVKGNQPSFDMTATRRLMLKAQQNGLFVGILRQGGDEEANAAATRWHVSAQPSAADPHLERGIGLLRLSLVLERNRNGQTGHWTVAWNQHEHGFEHVPTDYVDRPAAPFDRPDGAPQMGQVMAFERAS